MARLRPLRTKEEIAKVPPEKSVTIELQPEGVVTLEENPFEDDQGSQPERKPPVKKVVKDEDDSSDLKRQLEEMKRAKEDGDRRIQEEIRARQDAERMVREREQEAGQSRIRAEDAEYDAILNAIGAAESEAESAERDIAIASDPAAPDPKRAAEAHRRMSRAEARLVQLQDGKDAIERAKATAATRAKEQPVQRKENPTVEQYVDQLPNLAQSQREWLKKHPDALTDNRKNMRLQGAHVEAEDQGLSVGSTEYFEYLEERLGYRKQPMRNDDDDEPAQRTVSAPPSRNATNPGSGRRQNNQITLSPEQREMAKLSGIDEITYARQLERLNQLKDDGHYRNN